MGRFVLFLALMGLAMWKIAPHGTKLSLNNDFFVGAIVVAIVGAALLSWCFSGKGKSKR